MECQNANLASKENGSFADILEIAKSAPPASQGTGFAITANGHVATAFHVVSGAKRIQLTFADGTTLPATIESSSRANDLAILKAPSKSLKPLPIASSRSVKVGKELFTVGYPVTGLLGSDAKYTNGSLSSKSGLGGEASLLQITVPIQPGNSGGPVVTDQGRVVGIVTSTAAIKNFMEITGTLPQSINWAIKAEYAKLMFEPTEVIEDAPTKEKAIERAMAAVCLIEVWK